MTTFDNLEIENEYNRWLTIVGADDPYEGPNTIGLKDVLRAHFLLADHFYTQGEGIGGIGPKSIDALHSALHRQHTGFGVIKKWSQKFDICATLFFGLIKDHPFHDANKRTAFLSALFHIQKIGCYPDVDQKIFEDFTVEIAENGLAKYDRYEQMLKKKEPDAEVKFISYFLKKNCRPIDKRYYAITFNDLNRILHGFGFGLENPRGNYIDVVKYDEKFQVLFFERKATVKIGQIGFPSWKSEVNQNAIKAVRKFTKLDDAHGVDSKTFFHGYDVMTELITSYREPLRRLADR